MRQVISRGRKNQKCILQRIYDINMCSTLSYATGSSSLVYVIDGNHEGKNCDNNQR